MPCLPDNFPQHLRPRHHLFQTDARNGYKWAYVYRANPGMLAPVLAHIDEFGRQRVYFFRCGKNRVGVARKGENRSVSPRSRVLMEQLAIGDRVDGAGNRPERLDVAAFRDVDDAFQ